MVSKLEIVFFAPCHMLNLYLYPICGFAALKYIFGSHDARTRCIRDIHVWALSIVVETVYIRQRFLHMSQLTYIEKIPRCMSHTPIDLYAKAMFLLNPVIRENSP